MVTNSLKKLSSLIFNCSITEVRVVNLIISTIKLQTYNKIQFIMFYHRIILVKRNSV